MGVHQGQKEVQELKVEFMGTRREAKFNLILLVVSDRGVILSCPVLSLVQGESCFV